MLFWETKFSSRLVHVSLSQGIEIHQVLNYLNCAKQTPETLRISYNVAEGRGGTIPSDSCIRKTWFCSERLCADQFETSTSPPGHTPGIWMCIVPGEEGIWTLRWKGGGYFGPNRDLVLRTGLGPSSPRNVPREDGEQRPFVPFLRF